MSLVERIIDNLLIEEDEWIPIAGYEVLSGYKDEHPSTTIVNKIIGKINGLSLSGEKNSEYVTFQMNRFYDGIDLSNKLINICYTINNTEVGDSCPPINVFMNNQAIKFGWLFPEQVTLQQCSITFIILMVGKEYNKDYILKTKTANYSVENSFKCGEGIIKPDDNWFEQFLIRTELYIKQKVEELANSYDSLKNKPSVNGIELLGNKTFEELGLTNITSEEINNLIY